MKKHKIINIAVACIIAVITILPLLLFRQNIRVTKYSIPAICLCAFHIIYGLLAYALRHKRNYLPYSVRLLRHFAFNLFESDKDYTYTKEYNRRFFRMLAVYFAVVPMYIPCILLTSAAAAMPVAVLIFLFPQLLFLYVAIRDFSNDVKFARQRKRQLQMEKQEQERREKLGKWK